MHSFALGALSAAVLASCSGVAPPAASTDTDTRYELARVVTRDPEDVVGSRQQLRDPRAPWVARQLRQQHPRLWGEHYVIGHKLSVWIKNGLSRKRALTEFADNGVSPRDVRIKRQRFSNKELHRQLERAVRALNAAGLSKDNTWMDAAPFYPWQAVVFGSAADNLEMRRVLGSLDGPPILIMVSPALAPGARIGAPEVHEGDPPAPQP